MKAVIALHVTIPPGTRMPHFQETLMRAIEAHGGTLDKAEWRFPDPPPARFVGDLPSLLDYLTARANERDLNKRHNQSTGDST